MQIAHGVDCEHIGEHGDQEHIHDQTYTVADEIGQKVNWSIEERYQVDAQHDGSTQDKDREVVLGVIRITWVECLIYRGVALLNRED